MSNRGNLIIGTLIATASVSHSPLALARVAEPAPELKPWVAEYLDTRNSRLSKVFPERILILADETENLGASAVITEPKALERLSPFKFVDQDSATLTAKINLVTTSEQPSFNDVAKIIPANIFFTKTATKRPNILVNIDGKVTRIKAASKFPGTTRPEVVVRWIFKSLGYDAFVVAKKGRYFLVAGSRELFQKKSVQALAIRNSESKLVLTNKKRSGVGLIELESSDGSFAIFKLLALAKNAGEIPVGAKLLVQKAGTSPN